jgi:hypothetical protein
MVMGASFWLPSLHFSPVFPTLDLRLSDSGNFFFCFLNGGIVLPHHEDLSVTLEVGLQKCHVVADRICCAWRANPEVADAFSREI